MEASKPLEQILQKVVIQNFSLVTRGLTKDKEGDFWVEKEPFSYNGRIEAERVTGMVGLTIELLDALVYIETPKSNGPQSCRVIASTREFSPIGKDYDYVGNPALKFLFQDTVIKKPFTHILSEFMLDASTRPMYQMANNETVAQPFNFDYQVDPSCPLGLNRNELSQVEKFIDQSLSSQMREFLMNSFIRKSYIRYGILPYAKNLMASSQSKDNPQASKFGFLDDLKKGLEEGKKRGFTLG